MNGDRQPSALPALFAAFPAAVEFLTPVRLHAGHEFSEGAIGSSSAYFPIVGVLIGLILVGVDRLAGRVLPTAALNAVLVIALALATGLFHLDGLADTADGVFGGATPERRLEIMRDSQIGSYGAAAIVMTLLLQWALLADLVSPWRRPALLLFPTCTFRHGRRDRRLPICAGTGTWDHLSTSRLAVGCSICTDRRPGFERDLLRRQRRRPLGRRTSDCVLGWASFRLAPELEA